MSLTENVFVQNTDLITTTEFSLVGSTEPVMVAYGARITDPFDPDVNVRMGLIDLCIPYVDGVTLAACGQIDICTWYGSGAYRTYLLNIALLGGTLAARIWPDPNLVGKNIEIVILRQISSRD